MLLRAHTKHSILVNIAFYTHISYSTISNSLRSPHLLRKNAARRDLKAPRLLSTQHKSLPPASSTRSILISLEGVQLVGHFSLNNYVSFFKSIFQPCTSQHPTPPLNFSTHISMQTRKHGGTLRDAYTHVPRSSSSHPPHKLPSKTHHPGGGAAYVRGGGGLHLDRWRTCAHIGRVKKNGREVGAETKEFHVDCCNNRHVHTRVQPFPRSSSKRHPFPRRFPAASQAKAQSKVTRTCLLLVFGFLV